MELTCWGATSTVTGSRTMVRTGRLRWLVACGLFQGFKTLLERNWAPMPLDPGHLNGVFLTHAHIDHSGALPLLTRQGYTGRIYMTPATARLCEVLLMDTAHLQQEEHAIAIATKRPNTIRLSRCIRWPTSRPA